jgi:hypothetical protein
MNPLFFWTAALGWLGVLAFLGAVAARILQIRISPHYALGAAAILLGSLHAVMPMAAGLLGRGNMAGFSLASLALLLLFVQGGLGLQLMNALPVRRAHLAAAAAIGVLIAGHVALNRVG